jgi:hypothetical protein
MTCHQLLKEKVLLFLKCFCPTDVMHKDVTKQGSHCVSLWRHQLDFILEAIPQRENTRIFIEDELNKTG